LRLAGTGAQAEIGKTMFEAKLGTAAALSALFLTPACDAPAPRWTGAERGSPLRLVYVASQRN